MPRSPARRLGPILIPFALLVVACGRLNEPATSEGGQTTEPPIEESFVLPTVDSPMLADPYVTPWDGGDPDWDLSFEEIQRILYADITSSLGQLPDLPDGCYSTAPDSDGGEESCLFLLLRELGVSDDAIRFYVEEELVVLDMLGSGPVKAAKMWWGPGGAQDTYTPAAIFVPGGYMSASPGEWAPYATALEDAYASDTYGAIASIEGTSDGYPLTFSEIPPSRIAPPVRTASGWGIAMTALLRGGCMGCDIEFAGRFVLEFSEEGAPVAAGFDGFCYLADYEPGRGPDFDWTRIDALKAELPICPDDTRWPRD